MVRCNLIKLGVGWPEMWPERTDLRHKLVTALKMMAHSRIFLRGRSGPYSSSC
jgi:hypothetical protein